MVMFGVHSHALLIPDQPRLLMNALLVVSWSPQQHINNTSHT
jgi:hypothetical protein